MALPPRDPKDHAEPDRETEPIVEGELLSEEELERTSHMSRSDLAPLLAVFEAARAEAAAIAEAAEAELEKTQEIPAQLIESLQRASRVPQRVAKAPVAPGRSAAHRRSEFEAAMARLAPDQQNRVRVAMAMVQVNVSDTPDDFAADFLRGEVAHHAACGSLDQLLDEMGQTPYPAKITVAYSTRDRGS